METIKVRISWIKAQKFVSTILPAVVSSGGLLSLWVNQTFKNRLNLSYSQECRFEIWNASAVGWGQARQTDWWCHTYCSIWIDVGHYTYGLQLSCFVMTGPLGLDLRDRANRQSAGPLLSEPFGSLRCQGLRGSILASHTSTLSLTWCKHN